MTLSNSLIALWSRQPSGYYLQWRNISSSNDTLQASEISPNGQFIAAAGSKSRTYVWRMNPQSNNYEYFQTLNNPNESLSQNITCVSFSRASNRLITGSSQGNINVWNLNPVNESFGWSETLFPFSSAVTDVTAKNERLIATGLNDQRLNIWILNPQNNTYGSNPNQIILIGGVILSADYSDMESIITVGLQSGDLNVYFYSPDSNNYFSFQNISQASSNGVQTVAISGDSMMIATSGSDQFTTLYELSGNFQQSSRVQRWGSSLDFNNISQLAIG